MSASTSDSVPKSATSGPSHKRKKSPEEDLDDVARKRPFTASRLQSVEDASHVPSREADDGAAFHSNRDRGLHREMAPPTFEAALNTNSPIHPTHSSVVNTGGGAHFDIAQFTGSGVAFGNNNIINNSVYNVFTIIRSGDGQFTEAQRNLICDYISKLAILPGITDSLNRNYLTQLIINLPRAEAVFNDYQTKKKSGPCFEGTRVALLREMADWVTGTSDSMMYILSGLAGIGKSTVAYTIASRAADLNLLGASFFFSRDEADRKNAKKCFTTIAYQLCAYNETFAKAIGDALLTERGSAATTKDPEEQLQTLIVDPLRSIVQTRARPVLIVVDALDECDEDDVLSVLTGLRQLVQVLPPFKVILTTRPQPHINRFFDSQCDHEIFYLQDIEDKVVDGDIRLYLKHSLSMDQVRARFPRSQWCANDEEINALVRATGRLFIIASTSVRYIFDKFVSNPVAQLKKLLCAFSQDRTPFKDLDHFYTLILRNLLPLDCDNHDIVARYQSVIGAIIFVQHPLPVTTLAHLVDTEVEEIRIVLDRLQSVILLGDDDIPRIYHASLPDYISDSTRCQEANLRIDPRIRHTRISIRCLEIMDKHLKYNVLGLSNIAQFMNNEDGLAKDGITDEQLETHIPQPLQYACVYWGNHMEAADVANADLKEELEKFVDQHMLHWFETLSLVKKLDSAHRTLRVVLKNLHLTSSNLRPLLSDGLRFVSKFYEIIDRSALHTYHSALMFTPTDSVLYHRYFNRDVHKCHVIGALEKWDALVTSFDQGNAVNHIQFSLDNTMFASQSAGVLKVWDAATGAPISNIEGSRVAITNDFATVASFKDNTLTLYNTNGSERPPAFTTRTEITRVAISSESSRIAAILFDGTVRLWDIGSRELIGSFNELMTYHPDQDWNRNEDFLQFSGTGARLTYMSANGFVHLRNAMDGSFITSLDCEVKPVKFSAEGFPRPQFLCVEFSRDGSHIASLQSLSGLKLWSCEDGGLVGVAKDTGFSNLKLAVSANGSLLAIARGCFWMSTVMLRSGNSGNTLPLVEALDLRQEPSSMAFSSDDTLAIASYCDVKLYNTKIRSFISTLPFDSSSVLNFSLDCTHLAAGNNYGTVYLWDIQGIEVSAPSSNKQTSSQVTALALSLDCSRVACGFKDGEIELWETSGLTKRRIVAHKQHPKDVMTLGFSPDGRRFASGSYDGTINLWDAKDGTLRGALQYPGPITQEGISSSLRAMAVSNSVLAAGGADGLVLWDFKTLDLIHTFAGTFMEPLSFSTDCAFLAAAEPPSDDSGLDDDIPHQVTVFDVAMRTNIATFEFQDVRSLASTFLRDNSHISLQPSQGDDPSLTSNLQGLSSEHEIQLPSMPLWHGTPISVMSDRGQHCLRPVDFFSEHDNQKAVPVLLWIPRELHVREWTQGSSMIALGCDGGRLVLLRLPTSHIE